MSISFITKIIEEINRGVNTEIRIMEVCGTHTEAIHRYGISTMLSSKIKLLSGPGCPVCVTDEQEIDDLIQIINQEDVMVVTFGDMIRVPGKEESLSQLREKGKKIVVIYSPIEAVRIAEMNEGQKIIFWGVGFETTAPLIALTMKEAVDKNLKNLYFYLTLKTIAPTLHFILNDEKYRPHGIICPGHIAAVKGADYFNFIVDKYKIPAIICGFEPEDIIMGIYCIIKQINKEYPLKSENLYKRCVKDNGNKLTNDLLNDVFDYHMTRWRGIGNVENSALVINKDYEQLDAKKIFSIVSKCDTVSASCQCGDILLGKKLPLECFEFNKKCTPLTPKGPCMISREGACYIHYLYMGGV